jgi:hypothetical protein
VPKEQWHFSIRGDSIALVIRVALTVSFAVLLTPHLAAMALAPGLDAQWARRLDRGPRIRQRLGPDDEHRARRQPHRRLSRRPQQHSGQTTPTVRPHHYQVSLEIRRQLRDLVRNRIEAHVSYHATER